MNWNSVNKKMEQELVIKKEFLAYILPLPVCAQGFLMLVGTWVCVSGEVREAVVWGCMRLGHACSVAYGVTGSN